MGLVESVGVAGRVLLVDSLGGAGPVVSVGGASSVYRWGWYGTGWDCG